ncbi:MAG TPA: phage tail protein [Kofleriaceae bacterium]|nr:phage tail protein [Kofleriaceae bacterium]
MPANSPGNRKDPLPVFCFKVELALPGGGGGEMFFKSVSGIKYETEIVPVREGGTNDTTFQLPGATKWSNLVMKKGFTGSSALLQWRKDWLEGKMTRIQTGNIIQLDTALNKVATWTFFNGWPAKWDLSELDASKSELSIETLEIAHEGLRFG